MTSQINTYSERINTSFPIAGQNNDSQGFRSNFSNIQSALNIAASEITTLQTNGVNLNKPVNDLGFNSVLTRAQLQNSGVVSYAASTVTNLAGYIEIDYAQGSYQTVTITTTATFKVVNWPVKNNLCSNLRLAVRSLNSGTINFNAGSGLILSDGDVPYNKTSATTSTSIWDLWSSDSGSNVFVKRFGNNYV
jgi:hypothetical protein